MRSLRHEVERVSGRFEALSSECERIGSEMPDMPMSELRNSLRTLIGEQFRELEQARDLGVRFDSPEAAVSIELLTKAARELSLGNRVRMPVRFARYFEIARQLARIGEHFADIVRALLPSTDTGTAGTGPRIDRPGASAPHTPTPI